MKEYLNRLLKGKFLYQRQKLIIETEHIEENVTSEQTMHFTFFVKADTPVRGVVYTENEKIAIDNEQFAGEQNEIGYQVNAKGLAEGSVIEGAFYIVSDAGEAVITYRFQVLAETVHTSLGQAHTMFHFANLVQTSPEEAAVCFQALSFKHIFLNDDLRLCNIYDAMKHIQNVYAAMEEFLIAVKKKTPVTITISHDNRVYKNLVESQKEVLTIQRSTWGYVSVDISTEGDFIQTQVHHIGNDGFTGNRCELEYMICVDKLHAGKNYGMIRVRTFSQELVLRIEVDHVPSLVDHRYQKEAVNDLTIEYLRFRIKQQDQKSWLDHSMQILDRVRGLGDDSSFFMLAQAQVFVVQNRYEEAEWLIRQAGEKLENDEDKDIEVYCYYLYVHALYARDAAVTAEAVQTIRHYYENGYDTWRILWILFYIDATQDRNKSIKLIRIKDAFHNGCISPVMYYEAIQILNTQPALLRVFNEFELQVLRFGCKYHVIDKKLILHACDLIANEKIANIKYLKLLREFYAIADSDEVLTVLVSHMIRNELKGSDYIQTYERAILRGLKITKLYEFYMESLNYREYKRLPQIVLRYFTYGSQLSDSAKAYLYANIIYNHSSSTEIMTSFGPQIERFAYEQMRKGLVDDSRVIIYRYVLQNLVASEEMTAFLARFLFTYKVTVYDENIAYVLVKHKEMRKDERYPVVHHAAFLQMYTRDCILLFEDTEGNIRRGSLQYELERVYPREELLRSVCAKCSKDIYIMLYLFEQALEQRVADETIMQLCLALMDSGYINEQTRNGLNGWLIRYYHEKEPEEFFAGFDRIHKDQLDKYEASLLIETCIQYEMYEDAFDLVKQYGYASVADMKLLHMLRGMITLRPKEKDETLLSCCEYVFFHGKYDENVLGYMQQFYISCEARMLRVWNACMGFHTECLELAKRILTMALFSGCEDKHVQEVFVYLYQNGNEHELERAYIAQNAYDFFVKRKEIDIKIFDYMQDYAGAGEQLTPICAVAYVAYYAANKTCIQTEACKTLLRTLLETLCKNKMFFACYSEYRAMFELPYHSGDLTTVEYRADADVRVRIFYKYQNEEEYKCENLKSMVANVYTKSFMLFYGETIQYYFEEERGTQTKVTESASVTYQVESTNQIKTRFDYINEMLVSMEMHDMVSLKKMMQGYCIQDYVTEELFQPFE